MHPRNFFSKINSEKTKLQTTVEWHTELTPLLEQQIVQTHLASFLDLYRPYSENQLGLIGKTKEIWLNEMIRTELQDIKAGNIFLATVSIENNVVGFITCLPPAHRHNKNSSSQIVNMWRQNQPADPAGWQESIRKDVYISLLAVKPFRDPHTGEKIQIGLGRQLIESVEAKITDANALTLDTRLINMPGIAFYEKLGFSTSGERTFGGSNPAYYTGCEKQLVRLV
ncbi:MAG: GNAT family N-acetyltransferase [Gammaproteobacteria bacterium]|nr:GNAT family N-acetyltransferase [Gammaproteobacteria bacterium]MCW5582613.1 GNAT family N-acetyltransferase [Gammaproteobacteria bacterium]